MLHDKSHAGNSHKKENTWKLLFFLKKYEEKKKEKKQAHQKEVIFNYEKELQSKRTTKVKITKILKQMPNTEELNLTLAKHVSKTPNLSINPIVLLQPNTLTKKKVYHLYHKKEGS